MRRQGTGRSAFDDEVVAALLGLVVASRRGARAILEEASAPPWRASGAAGTPSTASETPAPGAAHHEVAMAVLGVLSVARQLDDLTALLPAPEGLEMAPPTAGDAMPLRELLR